jgi:hypothetical protein
VYCRSSDLLIWRDASLSKSLITLSRMGSMTRHDHGQDNYYFYTGI